MERKRSSRWRGDDVMEVKEVKEVNEVKDPSGLIGPVKNYKDLLVYQQAYKLALQTSKLTKSLPREEQYELGKQLRRCARSVPANIVEDWAKRNSATDFRRHLVIASGEVAECKFWIELAGDEGFLSRNSSESILKEYAKLGFMIHKLWKEWRKL
jgi:four helix bundle protein